MSPKSTFAYCARLDHWPTSRVCCHCTAAKRICGAICAWPSKTCVPSISHLSAAIFKGKLNSMSVSIQEMSLTPMLLLSSKQKQEIPSDTPHCRFPSIDFGVIARTGLRLCNAPDEGHRFIQIDARLLQHRHQRVRDAVGDVGLHTGTASFQLG